MSSVIILISFLINYLKKETIFRLGNFNINLLNYDIHHPSNEFLDSPFFPIYHSLVG